MHDPETHLHTLADGRQLAYCRWGDQGGAPTLFMHGFPGCRLQPGMVGPCTLNLIAPDRPGIGRSDAKPARDLRDWVADCLSLADHVGFDRFHVLGVSGGGPYACALAALAPDRVNTLGLLCPLGPPEAPGMKQGRIALMRFLGAQDLTSKPSGWLLRAFLTWDKAPELAKRTRDLWLPFAGGAKEREVLAGDKLSLMMGYMAEALHGGTRGLEDDARIYGRAWPFNLEDIRVRTVLWHGDEDSIVPLSVGRHIAEQCPNTEFRIVEGEGHYSLVFNQFHAFEEALTER